MEREPPLERRDGVPADTGLRLALALLAGIGGVALQLQQPRLWPVAGYLALLAAGVLLGAAGRRRWRWLLVPALLLAGLGYAGGRAALRLAEALPPALEGRDLQVTGVVSRMPQPGPQGPRFVFEVEQATLDAQPVALPRRLSLSWLRGFDDDGLVAAPPQAVAAGQRWSLPVRLRRPHGPSNPRGFDLELWLFEQGLGAVGSVRAVPGATVRLLGDAVAHPVERARQHVRDAILLRVDDAQAAGVLAALAVGDQAAIERDEWALFRDTGVAHLMSISGLHVTMFAWLAGGLVGWAWRRSPRLMHAWPAPQAARWGGVAAAAGYALLAGWGVPAQRTVWMLVTVVALRGAGLRWPPLLVLLVAAAVVTLLDPWALLQPGFWLSFCAVALLMLADASTRPAPSRADGPLARLGHAARSGLRTQAVASLGLAPLSMVFFQQVSLVGFAANLVAIPLVTLLITPLTLAGIVLPPLWAVAGALTQALMVALRWAEGWPFGVWTAAAASGPAAALGLLGGALLLMPLPWRMRLLGLALLPGLLAPPPARPGEGRFEVVVADIGQGTAVLVRTRAHLLVYDAGPRYGPQADAAQRVLLPLLHARGESAVDLLMLSHRDLDHVGGAGSLLATGRVRALSSSLEPTHPLRQHGLPHQTCAAGQRWRWDGVGFEVLHPLPGAPESPQKPNALSCVLRVEGDGGRSLLLTGDIEAAQEAALVAREGRRLRSQVLLVPHHGSQTSSGDAFLGAVAPGTAVVQAGYRNRFGHPAPSVEGRYRDLGVEWLRSDRCGAWTWRADGTSRCEREAARRYWHHPLDGDAGGGP